MSERRVLVVDDEPQLLRALKTTLRGAGYSVDTATNGEEALALAASAQPDAIILDLVLPDLSGVEVCRELRRWSNVPVLILSAVGDESQKVAALDAGADDYVTKPFGVAELLARLRASLRRVSPAQEPIVTVGELVLDLERSSLDGRRSSCAAHAHGVRSALATRSPRRKAVHAPGAPARGLGSGVPERSAIPTRAHFAPALQNRARSYAAALHPDRAWRRLPHGRS